MMACPKSNSSLSSHTDDAISGITSLLQNYSNHQDSLFSSVVRNKQKPTLPPSHVLLNVVARYLRYVA